MAKVPKELTKAPSEAAKKAVKGKRVKPPPKPPEQANLADLVRGNLEREAEKRVATNSAIDAVNGLLADLPAGVSREVVLDRCRVAPPIKAKPKVKAE